MAQPGQDSDFNFSFDDEEGSGAAKKGATAFGGAPRGREAPPPPADMHDEFEALPESPTGFGGEPEHHGADDSFGDVGGGDEHVSSPVQFGDEEQGEGAPPIYADAGTGGFGEQEQVEHFGEDAVDFEHDGEHAAGDHVDDDENVLRHAGHHEDDHELAEAPAVAQRSLLSRLIYPIGGLALLGAVGYFAWGYVSPVFFGSPAVQTAQGPQRIQMPPTVAAPNGMPAGGALAQRPPMPQDQPRPGMQQAMQQPPVAAAPKPLQPSFGNGQVTAPPAAQPPAAQPVQLATAVPDSMTGMNRPQPQSDEALKGISSQLEVISSNIGRVSSRLEVLERAAQADRSDFSGRIAALESRPTAQANKPATAPQSSEIVLPPVDAKPVPGKGTKAPSLVSEPKAKPVPAKVEAGDEEPPRARHGKSHRTRQAKATERDDGAEPGDVAMAGDEPPAKPVRLSAYRLQAASEISGRTIVSVRFKGRTEEFTVGQSIPGAGEIRSIRQNGGSWVVVTSRGVIVE